MALARSPSPETIADLLTNSIRSKSALNHVCHFNRCNIINLPVEVHRNDSFYAVKAPYLKAPTWVRRETLQTNVYSIYLCNNTGKIHHCHANCNGERMTNNENCQVCCVSGLQYESEITRSWQIAARCVPTVVADKRDPFLFSRGEDGRVKSGSGVHNLTTTKCAITCKETIHNLLFSKIRLNNERNKLRDNKKEAEKSVNKYKRWCERNNQTIVYIHMITLYGNKKAKRPLYTHLLIKTDEEKDDLIKDLTKTIISYYKMIVYKTNLGKEMTSMFNFKIFVPACLYIMKRGVMMGGIPIIESVRYLDITLPEANTLDLYKIHKPSFTQTKNNMLKAIRETVESGTETAQSLKQYVDGEKQRVLDNFSTT